MYNKWKNQLRTRAGYPLKYLSITFNLDPLKELHIVCETDQEHFEILEDLRIEGVSTDYARMVFFSSSKLR